MTNIGVLIMKSIGKQPTPLSHRYETMGMQNMRQTGKPTRLCKLGNTHMAAQGKTRQIDLINSTRLITLTHLQKIRHEMIQNIDIGKTTECQHLANKSYIETQLPQGEILKT